jgi:hypothetical protein
MVLADAQRKNRAGLFASRITEAGKLASLKVEKAAVDGERKAVEADLGPVRYLATLLGSTDEQTMRWFILVVAPLLDPQPSCCSRQAGRNETGAPQGSPS